MPTEGGRERKMEFHYEFAMGNKWTFEMKPIKTYLHRKIVQHQRILIPFAGQTRFYIPKKQITYIDIDPTMPQPCIYGDSLKILDVFVSQNKKFDLIISDPPYTFFQSVQTYKMNKENVKMQTITKIKEMYQDLLEPRGEIIHFGYNSTGMGQKRGFEKTHLHIITLGGSHNDILMLTEKYPQVGTLDQFWGT